MNSYLVNVLRKKNIMEKKKGKERKKKQKHVRFFLRIAYRIDHGVREGIDENNAINVCQYRCQSRFLHTCRGDP